MTNDDKLRDYLKRVTVDLHDVRSRLQEVEEQSSEPLAIVGIGCRYPGGIASPKQLWELVRDGRDAISDCPSDRGWDLRELYDPEPGRPGSTYVREGGFLCDAAEFDADFFAISPREALAMDPQQRLLLEASWEAIESAGIDPSSLQGSPAGVFIGGASNGYGVSASSSSAYEDVAGHFVSGTLTSVMSGRVSYTFGLEGPAVTIDTACSSSLVALHLACGSLRAGESSLALVGGACVLPTPLAFLEFSRQRALAPDGRCKPFANLADGLGWGEGVGMLLLERASDARRLGHRILAVVRGSAVNQDGASNGLTAPNGPSQQRVIRSALADAKLSPHQVDAVEAHGTGTTLGDPIEAQALLRTYGQNRPEARPLRLGSIKSNIGHTQAAAGVAGVIKMVMAMQHELLPKTLHVDRPSQKVDWSAGSVSLLVEPEPWPRDGEPRRAGVSSFGISGTNAHVILEEAAPHVLEAQAADGGGAASGASVKSGEPASVESGEPASVESGEPASVESGEPASVESGEPANGRSMRTGLLDAGVQPLIVSARDEAGLRGQAAGISAFLKDDPDLELTDVGFSLTRRPAFDRRAVAIGGDRSELVALLDAVAQETPGVDVVQGRVGPGGGGRVVFVFPGQGSQWAGMARGLLECSPVFARLIGECAEALAPYLDWSLEGVLREEEGAPSLDRVDVVQPVLFALMVSLAGLWRACGVRPDAVVGHSQGEIAAVCVAGGLSLDDGARIVSLRSQALRVLSGEGGMASVALPELELISLLDSFDGELSLAAVNGPASMVVSGGRDALSELLVRCDAEGVKAREIPVDYAAHSAYVEQVRQELLDGCAGIVSRSGDVPFYSSVTGGLLDTAGLDADYWYRNLRETVRFEHATRALLDDGCRTLIEVSPHPVLTVGLYETIEDARLRRSMAGSPGQERDDGDGSLGSAGILGSLRRGEGGPRRLLTSLGEAWACGVDVDWGVLFDEARPSSVRLPTYAFQRKSFWLEATAATAGNAAGAGQVAIGHPLVSAAVALAESDEWLFTGRISLHDQPWLFDHAIAGAVVVPGTTLVDVALSVGREVGCEVLQDLVHEATIVLSAEHAAVELQVAVGPPDESGGRAVRVFTRPEGVAWDTEDVWTRHARGVLAPGGQALLDGRMPIDASTGRPLAEVWPPAGAESVAVDDLYDYFDGMGLEYGPTFLSVRSAWHRGDEAFTEVRLPESEYEKARRFNIHPILLDASLQALGVLMRIENPAGPEHGRLPFAWTRVRLHTPGRSSVRVRLTQSQTGEYSLEAFDEEGRMVVSADSVVTRPFTVDALQRIQGVDRRSLFHIEWVALAPRETLSAAVLPESLAMLGERIAEGAGERSEGLDSDRDRAVAGTYPDLSSMIGAIDDGAPVPEVVLACFPTGEIADRELPCRSRRTLSRAVSLVQEWLADPRLVGSRLVFMTELAVSVGERQHATDLTCAPLWGLLRTVQSERPGQFVLVDVDDSAAKLDALASALDTGEPQLALRAGELLAPRLKRVAAERGEAAYTSQLEEQASDRDDRSRGVAEIGLSAAGRPGSVLITGGTGLIGSALARHLVGDLGVRSVVLASRRGEQAPRAESLRMDLTELGAEVAIVACDVSDREQLAQLLDSAPSEYPLSAIVHAAGDLDDGMIDSMTPERIEKVLRPKLDAAWYLHELTEQLDLSAFILFSSSSATIGSPGQSNYAAANAFLDALAAYRCERGLPGVSMAWGLWEESTEMTGGMTAADRTRIERAGDLSLPTEEGLRLFDVAYEIGESLTIPARLNVVALRARARAGALAPLLSGLFRAPQHELADGNRDSLVRRLASTPERDRRRVVLELVRAEVAMVLGHPSPDAIDASRAFNELGFDSLTAVELRNRLAFASGIQLPPTLAFDYPSSAALSDFLLEQVSPGIGGQAERTHTDADVRDAIASIPFARLRDAGVMDTLMQLAGLVDESATPVEQDPADDVDEMDLASLVQLSLGSDRAVGEPVEGS